MFDRRLTHSFAYSGGEIGRGRVRVIFAFLQDKVLQKKDADEYPGGGLCSERREVITTTTLQPPLGLSYLKKAEPFLRTI